MENDVQSVDVEILESDRMLEAMTRGEIDQQVATAKKYPRSIQKFKDKVHELATLDESTAEACYYSLPRGGKAITGPSIRLAEIVASSYQNLRMASRVIGIEDKVVVCEGACHDLENNIAVKVQIRRGITDKYGKRYKDDMIIMTSNAGNAIALRNAIFKVVPTALLQDIEGQIKKVAFGDERTMTSKRVAAFEYFKGKGISKAQVLNLLEKEGEADIGPKDLSTLHGLVVAIKEGDTTVEEIFQNTAAPSRSQSALKEKLNDSKGAEKPPEKPPEKAEPEATPEASPLPDKSGEGDAGAIYAFLSGAVAMGLGDDLAECLEAAGLESLESIEGDHEKLSQVQATFKEKLDAMTQG